MNPKATSLLNKEFLRDAGPDPEGVFNLSKYRPIDENMHLWGYTIQDSTGDNNNKIDNTIYYHFAYSGNIWLNYFCNANAICLVDTKVGLCQNLYYGINPISGNLAFALATKDFGEHTLVMADSVECFLYDCLETVQLTKCDRSTKYVPILSYETNTSPINSQNVFDNLVSVPKWYLTRQLREYKAFVFGYRNCKKGEQVLPLLPGLKMYEAEQKVSRQYLDEYLVSPAYFFYGAVGLTFKCINYYIKDKDQLEELRKYAKRAIDEEEELNELNKENNIKSCFLETMKHICGKYEPDETSFINKPQIKNIADIIYELQTKKPLKDRLTIKLPHGKYNIACVEEVTDRYLEIEHSKRIERIGFAIDNGHNAIFRALKKVLNKYQIQLQDDSDILNWIARFKSESLKDLELLFELYKDYRRNVALYLDYKRYSDEIKYHQKRRRYFNQTYKLVMDNKDNFTRITIARTITQNLYKMHHADDFVVIFYFKAFFIFTAII